MTTTANFVNSGMTVNSFESLSNDDDDEGYASTCTKSIHPSIFIDYGLLNIESRYCSTVSKVTTNLVQATYPLTSTDRAPKEDMVVHLLESKTLPIGPNSRQSGCMQWERSLDKTENLIFESSTGDRHVLAEIDDGESKTEGFILNGNCLEMNNCLTGSAFCQSPTPNSVSPILHIWAAETKVPLSRRATFKMVHIPFTHPYSFIFLSSL
jgi:hypothetical protein